jgi:hypothetical protein
MITDVVSIPQLLIQSRKDTKFKKQTYFSVLMFGTYFLKFSQKSCPRFQKITYNYL